jgi:hypothetical protein
MNLVVGIDYGRNVFHVLKNRWGREARNLSLNLLGTFLYHPEVTDEQTLNIERIDHNNRFPLPEIGTMTTRELIKTIRDCKTGTDAFNALLEECARKIEDALGGPESETTRDDVEQ